MNEDSKRPLSLDELSWTDAAAYVAPDSRVIIPVEALEQHGAHLPLASDVLIDRSLAADLCGEFGVLCALAFPHTVDVPADRAHAGAASLGKKVLHRALNHLLACWEEQGLRQSIRIVAHRHEPHFESLPALITDHARVRVTGERHLRPHPLRHAVVGLPCISHNSSS